MFYVVLEITPERRHVLEKGTLELGKNQPLPERLHTSIGRLRTVLERFQAQGLQGVGLKITEHQALRTKVDASTVDRLYLEGCVQVAVVETGIPIRTCNAQQIKAALATSKRLDGYVETREFRAIEGVDAFPKSKLKEWMDATAAGLLILEGDA